MGPLSFGKREEQIFLGREIAQHRDYSEATAIRIDEQVKKLVQEGYDRARKIIEERSDALDRIARALLEREVLDGSRSPPINRRRDPRSHAHSAAPQSTGDGAQQVIKPEPPRRLPGMLEGGPQPA